MAYRIRVNGQVHAVDADGDTPLLWVLRDILGLTGATFGCGQGLCGACTVHLDGVAVRACITPVASLGTAEIRTIETVDQTPAGRALQAAWLALDVPQCGYCQSGQIMAASPAGGEQPSLGRRHRRCHVRQCLPLRHLCAHPGRHQAGGRAARPGGRLR